jgi:DNA (cytosine-5)-methyltransferase 1
MKVGTFFSGVGSPEQALKNLNINHSIEFACDIDKYARQTYLKNFNCKNFYEDITNLNMNNLSYVDLLVFGFPCQAFSVAGKRKGFEDTRGTLFYDALRYLKVHKPRFFIAENVKGLLFHDSGKTFQIIVDCLAKTINYQYSIIPFDNLGYHIHYKVLNTKDFGIPQNRERIFIVGIRDDSDNNFSFPKKINLDTKLKDLLQNKVDDKYYLSEKQQKRLLERTQVDIRNVDEPTCFDVYNKRLVKDITMCLLEPHHNNLRLVTHSLFPRTGNPKKGGTGNLSKEDGTSYCLDTLNTQAIEFVADYRTDEGLRIRKDFVSPCLTSSMKDDFNLKFTACNPPVVKHKNIRRFTPIECERLQGFPDNHTKGVSDTQRYKQMGNTISVNVMEAILKNLFLWK